MKYEVSRHYVFPGSATEVQPGGTVDLSEAEATRLMTYEPGLLKLARRTTQAEVVEIRAEESENQEDRPVPVHEKPVGFLTRVLETL